VGHRNIRYHGVHLFAVEDLQGFDAVGGFERSVAISFERDAEELPVDGDIVSDNFTEPLILFATSTASALSAGRSAWPGVVHTDWEARRPDVALTREQVEKGPDIDTHRPVCRQHEAEYLGYYGYPYYWAGPNLWGPAFYPAGLVILTTASTEALADEIRGESTDLHLRGSEAVTGYQVAAANGEIGHVDGFLMDDEAWLIRYIEVAPRDWWRWFHPRGSYA